MSLVPLLLDPTLSIDDIGMKFLVLVWVITENSYHTQR